MITCTHLSKSFRIPVRKGGTKEAFKAFFKRDYRMIQALDDISFSIPEGEIVGYIGPNGAGKSSTIKIMSGILKADHGTVEINGLDPFRNRKEHVKNIGVVFGQRSQLWWDIPVIDSFELLKSIYAIPEAVYQEQLSELTAILDLGSILNMPTRQLSLGQRMRCEIAASLLHRPRILFLDEPTIGLDAISKVAVRSFIKTINQRHKTTIILTTHDMQDIESLVDRVILIGKGKLLFDGSMMELKQSHRPTAQLRFSYQGNLQPLMSSYEVIESREQSATIRIITTVSQALIQIAEQVEIISLDLDGQGLDAMIVDIYRDYEL